MKTKVNDSEPSISVKQELVIASLAAGYSETAAAAEAGISRTTIWQWKNEDSAFIAALNARRMALWTEHQDRLRNLLGKALDIAEEALDARDARTALAIIRLAQWRPNSIGETSVDEIERNNATRRWLDGPNL